MEIYHVQLMSSGLTASDYAAWGSVIITGAAIGASVLAGKWLQDRDQKRREAAELHNQIVAVLAIAEHCTRSIKELDERAQQKSFTRDVLGWLIDESDTSQTTAASIELMKLRSSNLTRQVVGLQEATRTARRRLRQEEETISKGNQPPANKFEDPLTRATNALENTRKLAKSLKIEVS